MTRSVQTALAGLIDAGEVAAQYVFPRETGRTAGSRTLPDRLQAIPQRILEHSKGVIETAGAQVLAIAKCWVPELPLDDVASGWPEDMDDQECHQMINEMRPTAASLTDTVNPHPTLQPRE